MVINFIAAYKVRQILIMCCFLFISLQTRAQDIEATNINQKLDAIRNMPFDTPFERSEINLLNWQHWPYSRYASHHPREFIPMATIHLRFTLTLKLQRLMK